MKRATVALAVAVLLTALGGPSTTALAAGGEVPNAGLVRHNPSHDGDESSDSGDNPDEGTNAGDAASDSGENSDDPGHHGDPGDDGDEPGGSGPCTSVSSVTACIDQPRN